MTTVSNQILESLKVKTQKRWFGMQFFGFDRSEIQKNFNFKIYKNTIQQQQTKAQCK